MGNWWPWLGMVICAVLFVPCFFLAADWNSDWDFFGFMGAFVFGIGFIAFLIMGCIATIGPGVDHRACTTFGVNSGYNVRFVRYNTLSWDCLVEISPGKWLSKDDIKGIQIRGTS